MKISKELASKIFYRLYKIRIADEEIARIYPKDVIKCPIHLSTGSEGVAVGVCSALNKTDMVIGGHRSHGIYLAKDAPLQGFMDELFGKKSGCSGGKGGSMHLISVENGLIGTTPILGSTIPIGVGCALASSFKKDGKVTAVFFGDGASEEGSFYESLNLAALFKLPVIFVCENNRYSIFQEQNIRQPLDNIFEKASMFGFKGVRVDGNDVVAVYNAMSDAVKTARTKGPVLLECMTSRWRQHVGPYYDYEINFGTKEELDEKIKNEDPIKLFSDYCKTKKLLTENEIKDIEKAVKNEVAASFWFAQEAPLPDVEDLYKDIY